MSRNDAHEKGGLAPQAWESLEQQAELLSDSQVANGQNAARTCEVGPGDEAGAVGWGQITAGLRGCAKGHSFPKQQWEATAELAGEVGSEIRILEIYDCGGRYANESEGTMQGARQLKRMWLE